MGNELRIAVLGLGAMGRRMAERLCADGRDVVVWSRSGVPSDAAKLGAKAADSARAAVRGADVVISMLTDDAASRAVWIDGVLGAEGALAVGALVIESSTVTPAWAVELRERVTAAGAQFLEAPVVGSRPQAEAGALVHLVGGEPAIVERARPVLAALGHGVHHMGPVGAGAVAKLVVNALFGVQIAALAELLGFARRAALDPAKLVETLGALPVTSPAAKGAAGAMLAGAFAPLFPVALVEKDFRYALAAADGVGARLPVVETVRDGFAAAADRGFAAENLTAIAKLYA
jgi:3-hydroxyisobutyrate dehydrogenase